ncbi:response regulator transcription factor [Profundibacter amoris]|uniref:DNA-binding response regulator n=1 Tax=Profundibacter amoris TaxID=2171755 RepID=A0A347UIB9_9RHOB|nr:response regulator transcription factor [Profundibacter amoris]AXX98597.1 DNA-binding response regulator [Profundibacter amoris]
MSTTDAAPLIHVVDDDEGMRKSLCWLIGSVGLQCRAHVSADAFMAGFNDKRPGCLLLDIRMPGLSGLDLQQVLQRLNSSLPVIFLTGHGDVPMAARAFKAGAFDFLEKPCNDQVLLDRVQEAVAEHRRLLAERDQQTELRQRINALTERERQVAERVSCGLRNKEIAADLGISQKTVELHRHNVMDKMQVDSVAELARIWALAET